MAPDVSVPANFGRHHIGAPSHGNLTFNMKEGAPIKANSIILSLNSPVIDNLTTNLHMTSVDVEDFSREAVDCFIEASYTGELEEVNVGNFRDVNKMSHVFEVSWLVAKCQEFFVSYLGKLNRESSYDDILFAVEEAVFVMSALKKRNFLELVVPKLNSTFYFISQRDIILNLMLSNLTTTSKFQLDACMAIAKSDVHVLVQRLLTHLESEPMNSLDENVRYLLRHLDLNLCFWRKPDVHAKLFSVLEDSPLTETNDFLLIKSLLENKCLARLHSPIICKSFGKYLDSALTLTNVLDELSTDCSVTNLYTFFEGLWHRLAHKHSNIQSDELINRMVSLKSKRGWSKLDHTYIETFHHNTNCNKSYNEFWKRVKECKELVDEEAKQSTYTLIHEYTGTQFLQEFVFKDKTIVFELPNSEFAGKTFIFLLKPMRDSNPQSFSMSFYPADVILNQSESGKEDDRRLPNLHFVLEYDKPEFLTQILPISWCGYPTHNKEMNYWEWGYFRSSDTRPDDMIVGSDCFIPWSTRKIVSDQATYRLVCFRID